MVTHLKEYYRSLRVTNKTRTKRLLLRYNGTRDMMILRQTKNLYNQKIPFSKSLKSWNSLRSSYLNNYKVWLC
jgi:hypothetical protein